MKQSRRQIKQRKQQGFSLLEILVVMVIMASIMGIVANSLGNNAKKAKVKETQIRITQLKMKIENFNMDVGYYPENLDALLNDNGDSNWLGPYVKKDELNDGWKQRFNYSLPGQNDEDFSLISYGDDKAAGGTSFDKDINSWD
jgi:general secretion pathway protein G